jgi:hypothetical protein
MRRNLMNFPKMFTKLKLERKANERPFDEIIGCEEIKRLQDGLRLY